MYYRATLDTVIGSAVAGAVFGIFPAVVATVGMIYYSIQVWESNTVQAWVTRRRHEQAKRRRVVLKMQFEAIRAELDALEQRLDRK